MHSMGLHSALAIKRQRKRRADQKKAKERRFSVQSTESGLGGSHSSCGSPRNSIDGTEHGGHSRKKQKKNPANGFESNVGIGMLQIGVVFVVLGIFLLGSSLIPNDFDTWQWQNIFTKKAWWNELVITGAFSMLLGIFLIVLDKFISKKEEDDLNKYVQGQLTRSRSGHRLVRDVETGNLVTKRSKTLNAINEDLRKDMMEEIPVVHSPKIKSPPANYSTPNHAFMNGETGMLSPQLEKILEEDTSVSVDDFRNVGSSVTQEEYDSTTASISPGTPSEMQELLVGTPSYTVVNVPVPSKYHQVRMSKI